MGKQIFPLLDPPVPTFSDSGMVTPDGSPFLPGLAPGVWCSPTLSRTRMPGSFMPPPGRAEIHRPVSQGAGGKP